MAAQRTKTRGDAVHDESNGAVPDAEPSILSTTAKITPLDNEVEIVVSSSFQVNLGNFENKSSFASTKARFAADGDEEAQVAYLWDKVYAALAPELEMAAALTVHKSTVRGDKDGTFIHLIVESPQD